jgi:hypothetical protein
VTKNDVLNECGRRLGDTSPGFLAILSSTFTFVVLELAQLGCISALRKTASFLFSVGTANQGILTFNTGTIAGLAAPLYPSAIHRLFVPAWGIPANQLQRKADDEFEALWLEYSTTYSGRPSIWRVYPNEQQLQVWPAADTGSASASCLMEYTGPPADLADSADIVEIQTVDIPTLLAGLYRHGVKFQDETIRDLAAAEQMWAVGIAVLKNRQVKAQFTGRKVQVRYRDF